MTRSTAKVQNVILKSTPELCKDCLIAKAKRKSAPKEKVQQAKTLGERLFIDISSPTQQSIDGNRMITQITK